MKNEIRFTKSSGEIFVMKIENSVFYGVYQKFYGTSISFVFNIFSFARTKNNNP